MAKILKIGDDVQEVNLYNGNLTLAEAGWAYKTDRENVTDTIELVSGADDTTIVAEVEKLAMFFRRAREFAIDRTKHSPVWFTWQASGEPAARRSLVLGGEYEIGTGRVWNPLLGSSGVPLKVAIEHQPEWEDVTQTSRIDNGLNALGGKVTIVAPGGSEDARIDKFEIVSAAVGAVLHRLWIGIRPFNKGIAGFASTWSCYLGTEGTDCTTSADATAKAGTKVVCNFATETGLVPRVSIQVKNVVGSNYDHMIGSYLVLGRLRVNNSATQVRAQLRAGWLGTAAYQAVAGDVYLDGGQIGTTWQLIPLGSIQIPPESNQSVYGSAAFNFGEYGLMLYLERLSASGYIELDSLFLVPTEHRAWVDGASFSDAGGKVTLFSNIDGQPFANGINTQGFTQQLESNFSNWRLPSDGGVLVFVGTRVDAPSLLANVNLTYQFTKRWSSFRST